MTEDKYPILSNRDLQELWHFARREGVQMSQHQAINLTEHGLSAALKIEAQKRRIDWLEKHYAHTALVASGGERADKCAYCGLEMGDAIHHQAA